MTFTKSVYFGVTDARCDVTVSGAEFCANADGRVVSLENVVIFFFCFIFVRRICFNDRDFLSNISVYLAEVVRKCQQRLLDFSV